MSDGVNDGMGVDVNDGMSEDMDDAKKYVMRNILVIYHNIIVNFNRKTGRIMIDCLFF